MNVNFSEAKATWNDKEMPPHPRHCFNDNQLLWKALTNEPCSTAEAHANVICENAAAKHANTNPNQLASKQDHSSLENEELFPKTP